MSQMRVLAIVLFVFQCLSTLGPTLGFDFFYLVQQWPGSYCKMAHGCCYPTTGKPAENFTIYGLWPEYIVGERPTNCNLNDPLDVSEISDLIDRLQKDWPTLSCPSGDGTSFWGQQWGLRGTCSSFDQHTFFKAALDLKDKTNLLQALEDAGIYPGGSYSVKSIKEAIEGRVGYEPYIKCNTDVAGNVQLYEVFLCVDKSASNFIECPRFPTKKCSSSNIEFPSFSSESESLRVVKPELRMVTSH